MVFLFPPPSPILVSMGYSCVLSYFQKFFHNFHVQADQMGKLRTLKKKTWHQKIMCSPRLCSLLSFSQKSWLDMSCEEKGKLLKTYSMTDHVISPFPPCDYKTHGFLSLPSSLIRKFKSYFTKNCGAVSHGCGLAVLLERTRKHTMCLKHAPRNTMCFEERSS